MKANYVVDSSKTLQKRNSHFNLCQKENHPHVFIKPAKKYAWVELDMISTDRNLDAPTIGGIFNAIVEITGSNEGVECHSLACRAKKVPKMMAETLASRIYQIAYDAMPGLKDCFGQNSLLVRKEVAA